MPAASTMTIDLPLSEYNLPPPIPGAALRHRRRPRHRPATLTAGMKVGVWRIERELGRGGMATVYAVVHTKFGKRAALKLAHRETLGPRFTPETFLREARTANLIDHAGVADVFATGTFDGRPYIVMERLSGRSLGARLEAGALRRDEALEILIELCDVLAVAHDAGVTHRDLKLDNVYVLESPGAGGHRTKLLDWGMARIAGEDDPLHGLIAGTLTYISPEQARGEDITAAADVYSLAVMAYQLLLGAPPFASTDDLELISKHLSDPPPRPSTLWSTIPARLEATLIAMLDKQPEARPSVRAVADALRAARRALRADRPSKLRWLELPPVPPTDVIGRPALPLLASGRQRVLGAALGVAMTVVGVLQLFVA